MATVVTREFVFEKAPFEQCHAATIEETGDGLVAAWFGGKLEGAADVGIWLSLHRNGIWQPPKEVAKADHPCWNPVLFARSYKELMLFYKVGPAPGEWWGMLAVSDDHGETWSKPRRLPDGIFGPIKNRPVRLDDGSLLCPSSDETGGPWRVHFERTRDGGYTWTRTGALNDGKKIAAIQPSILRLPGGRLRAIGRTRQGRLFATDSADGGLTWSPLALTGLPNPNSGTDATTLHDGRHVLVYNPVTEGRSPLALAVSEDAKAWRDVLTLEDESGAEFSYPTVIQTADGLVHTVYTWKRRRIRHVVAEV